MAERGFWEAMKDHRKLALYRAGKYVFHVPPVTHLGWGLWDWINYIDSCRGWRP